MKAMEWLKQVRGWLFSSIATAVVVALAAYFLYTGGLLPFLSGVSIQEFEEHKKNNSIAIEELKNSTVTFSQLESYLDAQREYTLDQFIKENDRRGILAKSDIENLKTLIKEYDLYLAQNNLALQEIVVRYNLSVSKGEDLQSADDSDDRLLLEGRHEIVELQLCLKAVNCYRGKIDGVFGAQSQLALKEYVKNRKIVSTFANYPTKGALKQICSSQEPVCSTPRKETTSLPKRHSTKPTIRESISVLSKEPAAGMLRSGEVVYVTGRCKEGELLKITGGSNRVYQTNQVIPGSPRKKECVTDPR